jgi:large subunit ribosomal protein L18
MVTVYRSSKHIYAQIVDRETGKTIGTVSSRSPSIASQGGTGNVEAAKRVGQALAALAREKRVDEAVFNRNGFLYHGRVKALAEAAREAGLKL